MSSTSEKDQEVKYTKSLCCRSTSLNTDPDQGFLVNLELDRQAQLTPDPDPEEVFFRSGFVLVAAVPSF